MLFASTTKNPRHMKVVKTKVCGFTKLFMAANSLFVETQRSFRSGSLYLVKIKKSKISESKLFSENTSPVVLFWILKWIYSRGVKMICGCDVRKVLKKVVVLLVTWTILSYFKSVLTVCARLVHSWAKPTRALTAHTIRTILK